MEHVNHPKHYNQHPNGIECIDIIRHYTCDIANAIKYLWRAGLKPEMGKEDAENEIEDLHKALWYIEDYHTTFCKNYQAAECLRKISYEDAFKAMTGHTIEDVCGGYPKPIKEAMDNLLRTGLIRNGCVMVCSSYKRDISVRFIQHHILDINGALLDKEIEKTKAVMCGQAIDGEDYVSKPGCVRETEPEKYDPLNMIIAFGRAYSLSDEVRKKENGVLRNPCENCDLQEFCFEDWLHPETSARHDLCRLHQAQTNEWYKEVGVAKYSPRFGTVEVVDELKEAELELKRAMEEEG